MARTIPGVIRRGNPFAGGVGGAGTQAFGGSVGGGIAAPVAAGAPNPYLRSGGGMGGSAAPAVAAPPPIAMARKGTGNKGRGNTRDAGARGLTPGVADGGGYTPGDAYGGRKGDTGAYQGGKGKFAANQMPAEYFGFLAANAGIDVGGGANAADKFNQWLGEAGFNETHAGWKNAQGNNGELGYQGYLQRQYGVPKNLYGKQPKGGKGKDAKARPSGVKNPGRLQAMFDDLRTTYFAQGGGANTNPATQVGYGRYSAFG